MRNLKTYVQGSKSPDSITEIVADIAKYSKFYVNMVLRKEADKDLNRLFANISKLKVDVLSFYSCGICRL